MTLDEILSVQRPSSNQYGLGFDKQNKLGYYSCTNQDGNKGKKVRNMILPYKK